MDKSEFLKFYDNCVKVIVGHFLKEHKEFKFVDNAESIYEEYIYRKSMLHLVYQKKDKLLDRHKVCACITAAICKIRPITSSIERDQDFLLENMKSVNEQLAFLSGWELLKAFVCAKNKKKTEEYMLPETFHNVSFVDTVTRSLFIGNQFNGLSIPLIANIFFLLEKYCEDTSHKVV